MLPLEDPPDSGEEEPYFRSYFDSVILAGLKLNLEIKAILCLFECECNENVISKIKQ